MNNSFLHQSNPQLPKNAAAYNNLNVVECQPCKKPRISSEFVSNSKFPLARNYTIFACNHYKMMGSCPYGQRCRFAHGIGDMNIRPNTYPNWNGGGGQRKSSNESCRLFSKWGKCVYGDKCRFLHVIPPAGVTEKKSFERKMRVVSGTMQHSKTSTSVSNRRMGTAATYYKQVKGMEVECNFKWNELEKMSRIYADWIDDTPLLHGSSSKVEC